MKHMGDFDAAVGALKKGGLTPEDKLKLTSAGWRPEITRYDVTDAYIAFADESLPGKVTLKRVSVKAGTEYWYNADEGIAILSSCGNPTCWRHLL